MRRTGENLLSNVYALARLGRKNGPKFLDVTECSIGNIHLSKLRCLSAVCHI